MTSHVAQAAVSPWTRLGATLRRAVLAMPPEALRRAERDFRPAPDAVRAQLAHAGETFVRGYHAALDACSLTELRARLDTVAAEHRGFAYEGAAMALALLDAVLPGRGTRFDALLRGPGAAHCYLVHVGAGWAIARFPPGWRRRLARLDSLLGWLALDGYGFHEGYFHTARTVTARWIPARLSGYARRAFDQGLGRSLWFVDAAQVDAVMHTIRSFAPARQADLWAGAGLAAAYAGGVSAADLGRLRRAAGVLWPHLAQGAAFAAKARARAGNPAAHTEAACQVLCGVAAARAAAVTDTALARLARARERASQADGPASVPSRPQGRSLTFEPWRARAAHPTREPWRPNTERPAYEQWRQHIRDAFARGGAT
jgi:hypothetical protein